MGVRSATITSLVTCREGGAVPFMKRGNVLKEDRKMEVRGGLTILFHRTGAVAERVFSGGGAGQQSGGFSDGLIF